MSQVSIGNSNYDEHFYYDDIAKFEENSINEDKKRMMDISFSNDFDNFFNCNNHSCDKSRSDIMSEIDPREYKLMKAMQSKDLVFIDSDDEEDPVKQVKSAPATFKTEMIPSHEIKMSSVASVLYNMENLFEL